MLGYPVLQSAVIDEKNAQMLQNMLFTPLKVVHVVEIVLITAGSVLLVATIAYIIYAWQRRKTVSLEHIDRTKKHNLSIFCLGVLSEGERVVQKL